MKDDFRRKQLWLDKEDVSEQKALADPDLSVKVRNRRRARRALKQQDLRRWLEEAWREIREDIPKSGFITQPEGDFTREGDIPRTDVMPLLKKAKGGPTPS